MLDPFEQDKQRILGPLTRDAAIVERARQDAQIQAAIKIERERQAEQAKQAQARQAEAQMIGEAERAAVEKLSPLKALYAEREAAARSAIEAIASLWRIEQEIRNGLQLADRPLQNAEALIEPSQRRAWRESLRTRAGLPASHIYAPDVKPTTESQAIGTTVCRGITSGVIQPGAIAAGHDVVNI